MRAWNGLLGSRHGKMTDLGEHGKKSQGLRVSLNSVRKDKLYVSLILVRNANFIVSLILVRKAKV